MHRDQVERAGAGGGGGEAGAGGGAGGGGRGGRGGLWQGRDQRQETQGGYVCWEEGCSRERPGVLDHWV